MKTYTKPKELVENPDYQEQRKKYLFKLHDSIINAPIRDIINCMNTLSYCFALQSCYGHFVYSGQNNPLNLEPLPHTNSIHKVEYRIAYIAFCVENSELGKKLLMAFSEIPSIDFNNIQFCSADWFWENRPIHMPCRLNLIGSNIRIQPSLITEKP